MSLEEEEEEKQEVSYLDVTLFDDGSAKIQIDDNGNLAKIIAGGIMNDKKLYELFAEVLILCQIKINKLNKTE